MTEKELLEGAAGASLSSSRGELFFENPFNEGIETLPNDSEGGEAIKKSTGAALLKHTGAWKGNDLKERLKEVYATRGEARF